jgi:hypothetical protein
MASVTRTNGLGHVHGTNYSTANIQGMEVDALVNLTSKGGIGSTVEAINQALQPIATVSTGTAGKIFMLVDSSQNTAASMQVTLRAMGTVDSINLSSATVTARDLDGFVAT